MKKESIGVATSEVIPLPLSIAMLRMESLLKLQHRNFFIDRETDHFETALLEPQYQREESRSELYEWCTSAEELKADHNGKPLKGSDKERAIRVVLYRVSCSFFAKSLLALARHENDAAWENLLESRCFYGQLIGRQSIKALFTQSLANLDTRHAENRSMKKDVFAWLDANMKNYKSMDRAAAAIAGKIVNVEFSTARRWISQWKKQHSTSTL